MGKVSNKARCAHQAPKECKHIPNATGDTNETAERQGQDEDSGTASDAKMSKANCSQENFDEGKVTKVNSNDQDMSVLREE